MATPTTSLSLPVAQAKLAQAEEIMGNARQCVANIESACEQMKASWQGNQATVFNVKMTQLTDDCNNVLKTMQQIIDTGRSNVNTFSNSDAG